MREKHLLRHGECGRHGESDAGRRFARGEDWMGGRGRGGAGHGGGHGGGGPRRLFDHGDLRLVVLKLIADKPRHGYELIKAIEDLSGGSYSPSPGTVYPALTMLEELGYASISTDDSNKKLYTITADGDSHLKDNTGIVEIIFHRLSKVKALHGDGPAPQILRAMENLKTALRLRLARGPLNDEQVRAVAAVLDDSATRIEDC